MNENKPELSISEIMDAIGSRVESMTVSEIAEETGKSERGIKTYLTRRGVSTKDYDGAGKKKMAQQNADVSPSSIGSSTPAPALTPEKSNEKPGLVTTSQGWRTAVFVAVETGLTIGGFWAYGSEFFTFWLILSLVVGAGYFVPKFFNGESVTLENINDLSAQNGRASPVTEVRVSDRVMKYREQMQAERTAREDESNRTRQFGHINPVLVCPHCQTKGFVRSKSAEEITRTKVVPIIGNTFKARKSVTQLRCDRCTTTWNV